MITHQQLAKFGVTPTTASSSSLPRVLIVNGEPASAATGTGLTLGHLFQGWPRGRFAQVYTTPLPHALTGTIDYHIPANARRYFTWLNLPSNSAQLPSPEADRSKPAPAKRDRAARLRAAAKLEIRRWLDLIPYELPDEIEQQILRFRPHLVYSCLGNIQISRLALSLARLCNVPVIPHFMDDWISTQYVGRPDLFVQRAQLLRVLESVVAGSPFGLAISGVMASEYSAMFRKPFYAFMNCVPVPAVSLIPPPLHAAPRLVYVGGLHLERWFALREIGDALATLNREGIAGILTVYAPGADLAAFGDKLVGPGLEIGGSLSQTEVPAAIAAADVLVHVESFEPALRKYTRLSISTKISQYATAARPLFCYGPPEVASLRFVHENAFGLVVGSQEGKELKSQLRRILEDGNLRQQFAENALAVARREFDVDSVRQRFESVLCSAVVS
jgi:glycosyltransferase involved in cell wall biosynthesis